MMRSRFAPPFTASLVVAASALVVQAAPGHAQQAQDTILAHQPLATREALEALVQKLGQNGSSDKSVRLLEMLRERLENGDFRPGDRVWLEVRAESALSDTFSVGPQRELRLPAPVVGTLSLQGVLRSEIEPHVAQFLARFIHSPDVRVRPLIRIAVQGEVKGAGIHGMPADAVLADALMAAGGTTPEADLKKMRVEREGETILDGDELQRALSSGQTLEQAHLRDGDQIIVGRRRDGSIEGGLRFLWVVVSLAGGIYGLSRAF
jgi:protein involved in polysaccharide export with SLBB domain